MYCAVAPEGISVPALALQLTPVFVVPVTEAVKLWLPPVATFALDGLIEIVTAAAAATVMVATADLVGSATLVAVTVYCPACVGAV